VQLLTQTVIVQAAMLATSFQDKSVWLKLLIIPIAKPGLEQPALGATMDTILALEYVFLQILGAQVITCKQEHVFPATMASTSMVLYALLVILTA
jgi:hypothetical protein